MAGNRYTAEVKTRVEALRKAGKTYAEIREQFPIPKSTLSVWLGEKYAGIFDRKAQLLHLEKIRVLSARTIKSKRIERERIITKRAVATARLLPLRDKHVLQALAAMLYWAEGAKTPTALPMFANTDPRLAQLYITLLRLAFSVDESRFRIRLHLHHYHKKAAAVAFWSNVLGVPPRQFGKIYWKPRSKTKKFRRNFMGICFITYLDISVKREMIALGNEICDTVVNAKPSSFNG